MNEEQSPPEQLTPAEERLREHLRVLCADVPGPDPSLIDRVVHTARWQRTLRMPLRAAAALAAALGDGIALLLGGRARRQR